MTNDYIPVLPFFRERLIIRNDVIMAASYVNTCKKYENKVIRKNGSTSGLAVVNLSTSKTDELEQRKKGFQSE